MFENQAHLFKAIAHPIRLEILVILSQGQECVCDLAEILHKRQPYISQQLTVLRDADLVITERMEKNIYYKLNKTKLNVIRQALRDVLPKSNPNEK